MASEPPIKRDAMLRKAVLVIAVATSTTVSFVAASAPARAADLRAADVGRPYARYRGVWGPAFYNGVPVSYGYGLCYRRELVPTPWGPRWRLVNRCY